MSIELFTVTLLKLELYTGVLTIVELTHVEFCIRAFTNWQKLSTDAFAVLLVLFENRTLELSLVEFTQNPPPMNPLISAHRIWFVAFSVLLMHDPLSSTELITVQPTSFVKFTVALRLDESVAFRNTFVEFTQELF